MDDTTPPLEPDQLDELLSAELDGELDAAARDLGLSVDDAMARLRAAPGVEDRRRALAAARGRLAEVPEVDELLAARLRAKAVRTLEGDTARRADEHSRRRNRFLLSAGGIAAAVLTIVALAAGLGSNSSKSSNASRSNASSSNASNASPSVTLGPDKVASGSSVTSTLGPFTDAHELAVAAVARSALENGPLSSSKRLAVPSTQYANKSAVDATAGQAANTNGRADFGDATSNGKAGSTTVPRAAGCGLPPGVPVAGNPISRAAATLAGKPVVVLVFAADSEHVVVIENADCTLSSVQMLR